MKGKMVGSMAKIANATIFLVFMIIAVAVIIMVASLAVIGAKVMFDLMISMF